MLGEVGNLLYYVLLDIIEIFHKEKVFFNGHLWNHLKSSCVHPLMHNPLEDTGLKVNKEGSLDPD